VTEDVRSAELLITDDVLWSELLHDWRVVSEHDGGYTLVRCRVCRTETVQ
jgi:hypothetical protein